ncbi:MAG: RsiV family protein [Candidatus Onthomonas sp.]
MTEIDRELFQRARQDRPIMPEAMAQSLEDCLHTLPIVEKNDARHSRRNRLISWYAVAGRAAAVLLALFLILPNVSRQAAYAMQEIPVLGALVRVITLRQYDYQEGNTTWSIAVPQVQSDEENLQEAAGVVNASVEELTQTILDELETQKDEGYLDYEITYDVVTDSDRWFTLKLTLCQIMGSGSVEYRFYHIDKQTGQVVTLGDLLEQAQLDAISQEIKDQMRSRMEKDDSQIYWLDDEDIPEWNFTGIDGEQNFYFDEDGRLVIAFNEYEVAPGCMGCPEFTIPSEIYQLPK